MALAPPLFVSPKPDPSADATLLQPSTWNRMIALLNGVFDSADPHGSVLAKDTSDAMDGGRWIPSAAGVLACSGAGTLPVFRALTAADVPPLPATMPPSTHHASHEPGGADALGTLSAGILTTGTLADARLSTNVVLTTDPRLTNARTPVVHATTHQAGGSDPLTTLDAGLLTTGTLANARLSTDVTISSSVAIGTNPATTGAIRLPNNQYLKWRNAANTADLGVLTTDINNNVFLGQGSTIMWMLSSTFAPNPDAANDLGSASFRWRNLWLSLAAIIGTNPATTGAIRLANNTSISARNAGNTADIPALVVDTGNNIRIGGSALVVNKVKAGAPIDTDVPNPADGMMVLDSTANKIWVRLGGVWKGVVVA